MVYSKCYQCKAELFCKKKIKIHLPFVCLTLVQLSFNDDDMICITHTRHYLGLTTPRKMTGLVSSLTGDHMMTMTSNRLIH